MEDIMYDGIIVKEKLRSEYFYFIVRKCWWSRYGNFWSLESGIFLE